ncbi:MAG: NAD-dependent DNA ligase LigA, partial [Clostridiales bacterium]|nr:NAD-dependent DNA ligase LigA [Clostridiales bacterium]
LDKTKDVKDLVSWIGNEKGLLSWKLDGLTIVLTYKDGELENAVTRGNGEVGEVITNNAKVFANIPVNISYKGDLTLRGEAVISYSDFYRINDGIEDLAAKYKNPRNLCSGSVRQLNNKITADRNVHFFAFSIVKCDSVDFNNSKKNQIQWLEAQGFDVVEYREVDKDNIVESVSYFEDKISEFDFPSDGLVLTYDNISYSLSLGSTSKFPRDSIAFKWRDEIKETKLLEIEWSVSRTGLINPIAVFEPVELEGTTVSRASVHNLSIMEALELGEGDIISVYKANMIIPQIADNITRSGTVEIPKKCPVCDGDTEIREENGVKTLYCLNPDCPAKRIKSFTHFVSRDALGVDGFSEATIEKFIANGFIHEPSDIFHIDKFKEQIVNMEGFGEKSYSNLIASINNARKTTTVRLLYSLGIPNIGLSNARMICKHFNYSWEDIQNASYDELTEINGIGNVMAVSFVNYFSDDKKKMLVEDILKEIEFQDQKTTSDDLMLENISFVITGSLDHFKNRNELKEIIEQKGGKVLSSVTTKTDYLINNDIHSNSSKNKKAKELGIEIISEEQFIKKWIN